jgi:uncharacterized protein (DUF885 family)
MGRISRRDLLMAAALPFLAPLAAAGGAVRGRSLRTVLDRVSVLGDRAERLAALRAADTDGLDQPDRIILRMIARGIEREEALRRRFPFGKSDASSPYVLSQRHGAYLRIGSGGAAADEVARAIDRETEQLRAEAARGVAPPAFLIDSVLAAERALASGDLERELRDPLVRQMAALERLRAGAAAAPGVWRLPGGSDYYALRLRCTAGADDSPLEVERRIAAETKRLLARADGLLAGLGLGRGSVGARLRALKRRPEYLYPKDETGRSRAVADMNSALARLRPHLPGRFSPPLEPGSSVKRMSPADERAARRGYRDPPTAAGPGAYYPDLSAVNDRPSWTLTTVAYHETIPGHLLQAAHQAAADPNPLQVTYAPGYSEGWAIHAERLADEMGLLSPVEQLGFLQSILFRLARVTADIGIHLRRWERARAVHYLEETVGFELFFPFAVEVDRYSAEPAGFAGDAMVALTLGRLAPSGPGARVRGFHEAVLDRGPLSAEAIEAMV